MRPLAVGQYINEVDAFRDPSAVQRCFSKAALQRLEELGALPAGIAADRYGARRVILFGLLVAGASACAAGLAEPGWPLAMQKDESF